MHNFLLVLHTFQTQNKVLEKSDSFKMDVVQDFIGIFATKEVNYDNFTFKMFYRATFGLCVLASLLLGLLGFFY